MKYVEIKGIGFPNKGAEILLCAVLQQLNKRKMIACMEPYSPFKYKLAYPIMTKISVYKYGINILAPLNLIPSYVLSRLGFIRPSQIDLILDASGFAYGDNWSPSLAKSRILSGRRIKTVLLPQSLGPFTKRETISVAKKLSKRAHKIISREHEGVEYFKKATSRTVDYCPDITFGFEVKKDETCKRDIIIVPNFQVYDREGEQYISNLVSIIEYVFSINRLPTLLNHEGPKDQIICEKIASIFYERKNINIEVLSPPTGTRAKEIIGASKFVITSRYHALIASMSQKVPVVCYGWSFKYNSVLKRFNLPLFDLSNPNKTDLDMIFSSEYSSKFTSPHFVRELQKVKNEVKRMWNYVFE